MQLCESSQLSIIPLTVRKGDQVGEKDRKTEGRWSKRNDKGRRGQRRKEGIGCCVNYSDMFSGKQQTVRVWNEVKGPAAIQSHAGKRKLVSVLFWCHWSGLEITLIVLNLTDITRKHWLTDQKPQIFYFFFLSATTFTCLEYIHKLWFCKCPSQLLASRSLPSFVCFVLFIAADRNPLCD